MVESVFSVGVDTFAADAFAVELVEDFEVELVLAGLDVLDPLAALVLLTAGLITITLWPYAAFYCLANCLRDVWRA